MSTARVGNGATARAAFLRACDLDVAVRKPGNVSEASAGHGMDATIFRAAARAAAVPLFADGDPVGRRIERAAGAAYAAAGCNANLGIVLLCAPIAAALGDAPAARSAAALRRGVARRLAGLDVDDTRAAFRAIVRANPGGLGHAGEHDVRSAPTIDLVEAMRLAADRDSVARQYANGFADVFDCGVPLFDRVADTSSLEAAMLATFIAFLRRWPDSHVARKQGIDVASALCRDAAARSERYGDDAGRAPPEDIAAWDADLKARGINPGTSADLAVATAFVCLALGQA
jgi:triphosphoribosyl-dephospho-CoA synthase